MVLRFEHKEEDFFALPFTLLFKRNSNP